LAAGRYDVLFSQCASRQQYPDQWYRGQTSVQFATPVTIKAGATTRGIDATMRPGATVTGTVVNSAGKPVNYVCVSAYNSNTGQFGFAITGKTGTYTMRALATGSYTVTFNPCNSGVNLQAVERHVKVTAGRTARGVNARLVPGGSAQGVVTVAGSTVPVAFACVQFISANPANLGGFGFTDANGKYRAAGIAPGSYKVDFNDPLCGLGVDGLAPQWYNDKPTQATADNVTITLGHTTTGIDAALQTDGAITGAVLGPSSTPLSGICVTAMPLAAGFTPVVAISGTSGGFTLTEMLPGQYKVEFSSGCGVTGYRTQWWANASSAQAAMVITVSAATTVPNINAKMTH
jgi:protocatechuate 3,4-dioxygenase beta subunit